MGVGYALACGDCLEFIDLHKWAVIEDAARCLISAHGLVHVPYQNYCSQQIPDLSNQPVVAVTFQQILEALEGFIPNQPYIHQLLPFIDSFLTAHQDHFLFLTCDIGERPWDFDEPQWYHWREIQVTCKFQGQFLPKNLVEDFGFHHWEEVMKYYAKNAPWFLHEQMRDEREALQQAFEQVAISDRSNQ
jgi:hypothetical protein